MREKGYGSCGWLMLIVMFIVTNGCASIISGNKQQVTFNSEPQGANVTVSGRQIGVTPVTTSIDRKKDQTLVFEKDGFKPATMQLTTTLNSWFWGNIVLGGLIGSTTDGLSGAYIEYAPSQYLVPLVPVAEKKANLEINKKLFVLMNYDKLVKELYTEPGEYTKTFIILNGIEEVKENHFINKMREIAKTTDNALVFADKVTAISAN